MFVQFRVDHVVVQEVSLVPGHYMTVDVLDRLSGVWSILDSDRDRGGFMERTEQLLDFHGQFEEIH